MAAGEEEQQKGAGKGFAGLASLVSDVDTTLPPAPKKEPAAPAPSTERPTLSSAQPQPESSQDQTTYQEPSHPQRDVGLLLGLGIFFIPYIFVWFLLRGGHSALSRALGFGWLVFILIFTFLDPSQTSVTPQRTVDVSVPAYSPSTQSKAPSFSPPVNSQAPSRPQESKPPIGRDLVFSRDQIRYCLAEDIRIEGAKSSVDDYSDYDVDRFNAMVADYNSRCASYRYRSGALESARRDIEPYRSQLQAEGRNRLARGSSTGSLSAPASMPSRPLPDATVQAVQRKLNEMGYSAGTADGLMGGGTRSAIIAFQRDSGLTVTGVANQALLLQLKGTPPRPTGNPVVTDTPWPPATAATMPLPPAPAASEQTPGLPANAYVMGANWYCKEGFRKIGNGCEALVVPENAYVMGANWYCKEGFRKVGNGCEALVVPENAYVMGANWYCKEGFRKIGNGCEALVVPENAYVMGANWYCKEGFRKTDDKCVSIFTQ